MSRETLRALLAEAVRGEVEAARGPACLPEAIHAVVDGRPVEAAQLEHIRACVACLYDAARLRQRRSLLAPGAPLSFLLEACDPLLRGPRGLPVTFSDGSTAILRWEAHADPDVEVLRLEGIEVVAGYDVRGAFLQSGNHIVVSTPVSAEGCRIEVEQAVLRDPAERWVLRLRKKMKPPREVPDEVPADAERPITPALQLLGALRPQRKAAGGAGREAEAAAAIFEGTAAPVEVRLQAATDAHGWATGWYVLELPSEAELHDVGQSARIADGGETLRCVLLDDGTLFLRAPEDVLPPGTRLVLSGPGEAE